ncbi:MAG: hypothetical protein AB1505_13535, partial [Candidatus Latescibacterota bacterium]
MSASSRRSAPETRLVGFTAGLRPPVEVLPWTPPGREQVDAMPELPPRPPRGWTVAPPAAQGAPSDASPAPGSSGAPGGPPAAPSPHRLAEPSPPVRPSWIEEGTVHALAWERSEEAAG